jgi:hypothetical protein
LPNRLTISIPDDLWYRLVEIQAFKQKQILGSVSMSDIVVGIVRDTVEYSPYYQGILSGKFAPEEERSPLMKKRLQEQKRRESSGKDV